MSAAARLLVALRQRGIDVTTADGVTLSVRPLSQTTEDDREGITALKPDLLRLLAGGQLVEIEIASAERMNGAFDWRGRRRCTDCGDLAIADGRGWCGRCAAAAAHGDSRTLLDMSPEQSDTTYPARAETDTARMPVGLLAVTAERTW